MRRHTPEQAAILALLDRVEALEAENRALHGRVSSVVAQLRAMQAAGSAAPRPALPAVLAGLSGGRAAARQVAS